MRLKRLAILHYHLRAGGVTTVIRNAQRALAGRFRVRILADFGYHESPARSRAAFVREAEALWKRLKRSTRDVDYLQTHNLTLGKHPRLTYAVKRLAEEGRIKVLHQIHDFPENERPKQLHSLQYCTGRRDDRFWRSMCYYDLPNVLWATLTRHAADELASHGVPARKIRVLPNPVDGERFLLPAPSPQKRAGTLRKIARFARDHRFNFDAGRSILLSPMKIMVRKNNAEAVELVRRLNRLHGRDVFQLLVSLDAESDSDRRYSEKLKRKIRREHLPAVIGAGSVVDAIAQYHLARAIVTTSKAEGFGYAFVEGWLCGKPVVGRDIPEVTRDFRAEGMDLRHLYRAFSGSAVRRIDRILAHPPKKMIARNRRVVLEKYSLDAYARRFEELLAAF